MALVRNITDHRLALTVGYISPSEDRNVDLTLPWEQSLYAEGKLQLVDGTTPPPSPPYPNPQTMRSLRLGKGAIATEPVHVVQLDGDAYPRSVTLGDGTRKVGNGASPPAVESGNVRATTLADLTAPYVMAHRLGGANIAPDNALESMEAVIAAGHKMLDGGDVRVTADGALVSMHDATVDRTTSSTGNVADHTAQSWKNLAIDAGAWFAPAWRSDLRPPFFEDIVVLAARRGVFITPEVKVPAAGAGMLAVIQKYRMERCCLVQSFTLADLARFTAAGIQTCYLVTSAVAPATITAAGVGWVGYDFTQAWATQAWIASLVAAGLKPFPYDIVRRSDWLTQQGYGAVGCASDDPLYVAGTGPALLADPFKAQTFSHGVFDRNGPTAGRGTFIAPKFWKLDMAGDKWVHQGWAQLPAAYTLNVTVTFDTIGSDASRMALIGFSHPDDKPYYQVGQGGNGYHVVLRAQAGNNLQVQKQVNGTETSLGAANGTASVDGQAVPLQITVAPGAITAKRMDTGLTVTTAADTTFRGPGLAFGKLGAEIRCSFSDVSIV